MPQQTAARFHGSAVLDSGRLRLLPLIAAALALCALVALVPGRARANGVPARIQLSYLANLSNFGPSDATGEAELSYAEGIVRLNARGLQALSNGSYELWLVKSSTNAGIGIGFFTAGGDGSAAYSGKLPQLTSYDYDLVLVTAQPTADATLPPATDRAIGGFFTPIQKPDTNALITSDTQPATLPNTGDAPAAAAAPRTGSTAARHEAAAALFAVGLLALYGTFRLRRRDT